MRRVYPVILVVLAGIVAGWSGYWLGHAFGWSRDADWPLQIGSGQGAIALSAGLAAAAMVGIVLWLLVRPWMRDRRVRDRGFRAHGVLVAAHPTGIGVGGVREPKRQVRMEVDVRLPDGSVRRAHATTMVTDLVVTELVPGVPLQVWYDPDRPKVVSFESVTELAPV